MMMGLMCGALGASPALAQTTAPQAPSEPAPQKLDPKACADGNRMTHGDIQENQGRAPADENLSDKLARTDGVICPPPGLDPSIQAPAGPNSSNMPVIPPPGSPGGDPSVRPK